ncbi:3040_t:CDS:2, partial [Acaulospora colombiana]
APIEVISLNDYSVQRVLSLEDFATSSTNLKSMAGMLTSHPWNSVELIETLIKMSDYGLFDEIRLLFERITKQSPEVVLLGLAQVKVKTLEYIASRALGSTTFNVLDWPLKLNT